MVDKVGFGRRITVVGSSSSTPVGGAILEIDAKKKTDMVFHLTTSKVFYLVTGKLKINLLRDGKVSSIVVSEQKSFEVPPGLIFQLEGVADRSMVVEFSSNPAVYMRDDTGAPMFNDSRLVSAGTPVVEPKVVPEQTTPVPAQKIQVPATSGEFAKMTPRVAEVVKEEPKVEEVPQETKTGKKKNRKNKRKGNK